MVVTGQIPKKDDDTNRLGRKWKWLIERRMRKMNELYAVYSNLLRIVDVSIAIVWDLNMFAQISGRLFAPPAVEYSISVDVS
ncbi:hypothetical protein CMV_024621 [Castanea mollissima]|uniref:Uncharacterized protein n=1 Tax=Castanea mollissima TaxID=60419 RepID=A0A8J4VHR3_9ROSI|nr:hypothetical protein CMV_024621 [Castanea mollissima]